MGAILSAAQNGHFWNCAMWPRKQASHSSSLEGLGVLQKISEKKDVWPGEVGIRPKACEDTVGVGKGLLGPKV